MTDNDKADAKVDQAERAKAWLDQKAEKRPKVTAEDVLEQMEKRKDLRRSRREEREQKAGFAGIPRWSLALGGVLLCGAIAVSAVSVSGHNTAEMQKLQNAAQIEQLELELKVTANATEENILDELTGDLATARDLARQVAMEQTYFSTLLVDGDHASPGNGEPAPAVIDAVMHREKLAPYFAPESFVIDDSEAYMYSSAIQAEPGRIDPRYSWFASKTSDWHLAAVMPSSEEGQLDVTWVSRDRDNGDLHAWAQGRYMIERGQFHDLTVGVTTLGTDAAAADLENQE